MPLDMILTVAVEVVFTVCVIVYIVRQLRGGPGRSRRRHRPTLGMEHLRGLATYAKQEHERIGAYVRYHWSGLPDQLPRVLDRLLDELERDTNAKGLPLDRESLKAMLTTSLRAHRIGHGNEVREALGRKG